MLWFALMSPLGALTFLVGMQRFETWMLAADAIRAEVQPIGLHAAGPPVRTGDPRRTSGPRTQARVPHGS